LLIVPVVIWIVKQNNRFLEKKMKFPPTFHLGLLIALCSGAAALAHELLWTRRLIDLLGGSSEANTRVLSLFFLGLSFGAVLAQAILPRLRRPWLAAAFAELAIAILALPALFLPNLTSGLWPALGVDALVASGGQVAKFLIAVGVIVPAATAMGTTLPLFVAGLLQIRGTLGREGIWAYATNTCGGLLGLIIAGGILLPLLGVVATMSMAIALNVALAVFCLTLNRLTRPTESLDSHHPSIAESGNEAALVGCEDPRPAEVATARWNDSMLLAMLVAFASGAGLLACEIVTVQTITLVVPLSFYAPLAVLATVVGLLAVAALIATKATGSAQRDVSWWLPRSLAAAGIAAVVSPVWYIMLVSHLIPDSGATVLLFVLKVSLLVFISFGPLFFLLGLIFPLAIMLYEQASTLANRQRWPWLLAVNGIGGLIGAECAYRLLLPGLGVHTGLAAVGIAYLGLAILVAFKLDTDQAPSPITIVGLLLVALAVTNSHVSKLPQMNPFLPLEVLSVRVGADGLVAVVEGEGPGRGILVSNQYMLGSTASQRAEERQAHLPMILHPNPRQVGFIGLATGITPGAALQHHSVESVLVAEISAGVRDAADQFFSESNGGITRDVRARVVVEDGRTLVAAATGRFDVLVGDLFLPWGAGASRLFSCEHFHAARLALRPQGLFCQWVPLYQLTASQFESILASFQSVFPDVYLFRNEADPLNHSVALIGFRDRDLSWQVVRERCQSIREQQERIDPAMRHWQGVAMQFLGRAEPVPSQIPRITLNNMYLEIDASRERVTGRAGSKYLQGSRLMDFLDRRWPQLTEAGADPEILSWQRLGLELVRWEWFRFVESNTGRPQHSLVLRDKIVSRLPAPMLQSVRQDISGWPSHRSLFEGVISAVD